MAINKEALIAGLEKEGVDMTKAVTGGFTPAAAGPVQLRFFAYIEIGKHEKMSMGKAKIQDRVLIGFELSGPNHPPRDDGTPQSLWIEENKSLNEKAHFYKLFTKMNHSGKAKHILSLLGSPYLGTITHSAYKRKDGSEAVGVHLKAKGETYDIRPPVFSNPLDGKVYNVEVAPLVQAERVFLWDRPDLEQWASIYLDGEYAEKKNDAGVVIARAKSKNVTQAQIMRATNFKGSATEVLLLTNGKPLDIPDAELPDDAPDEDSATAHTSASTPAGDPLAGIV